MLYIKHQIYYSESCLSKPFTSEFLGTPVAQMLLVLVKELSV